MKTRPTLLTIYRCTVALLAVTMLGLAAGCAWLLMPISAAHAAEAGEATMGGRAEAAYMEARLLLAAGQTEQAVSRLERARKEGDCPAPVYRALAEGYLRQRENTKALAVLKDGLKKYPESVNMMLLEARIDNAVGQVDEALAVLDKAVKLEPGRQATLELMSEARLAKIRRVRTQKELDTQVAELIKIYEQMLQRRQGLERIPPLLVLSSLYLRTSQPERAVAMAREAVQIHPRETRCYLALGQAQESLGQAADALKTYREVLLLDASNEDARDRIEKLLDGQRNPGAKRAFYGSLARDYPDDKQFQLIYARVLVAEKNWPEAESQLKLILGRWPEEAQSRLELARVWVALKKPDQALAEVRRLSQENKAMAALVNLSIAEALLAQGDRERALKILDEYQKSNPFENENATVALATLLLESKEPDRAIAVLEEFNKRRPGVYSATLLLMQAYVNKKRFDDAQKLLAALPEAVKKAKENDLLEIQSELYRRQKQWDKALETLKTLLQKDKRNAQLCMDAGLVCQELKNNSEAESYYRQAIELAPDDAETYNTLGYFYAETNQKLDEAQKLIEKALQMKPDAGNIMDSLGWVYYRKGNFQMAVEKLKRAAEMMAKTPDAVVFEHLGDAYEKLGQIGEARAAWSKAQALDEGQITQAGQKLNRTGK